MNAENKKSEGYVATGLPVEYRGEYGQIIDLGLAANPSGAAFDAKKLADLTSTKQIAEYDEDVHHSDIKDLLIEGIGLKNIGNESVIFHPNGSYGAGDEVIRALSNHSHQQGKTLTVYVPTYSFPNVEQYAARNNARYVPVISDKSFLQSDSLNAVLDMKSNQLSGNVVYVDYPNNPSGVANKDLLRKVVNHVSFHGGIPFVDLAFGEVLGDEFKDGIQYTIDRGGVCVGSLTKTQGLAALRAGYILMNPGLSKNLYSKGEKLVFGLPAHVKNAYTLLFTGSEGKTLARAQALKAINYNHQTNSKLYEALTNLGLKIAPTIYETPVQIVANANDDLFTRLACVGIKSESLNEYSNTLGKEASKGYGNQAVRILTPRVGMLEETIKRFRVAMQLTDNHIQSKAKK
ncbi:MAG: hypothetical protein UU16_C0017G0004 [Candidatus Woesebacteria bacterium GW2011_GWA2_40_7]|uniref:Aminotransferase class I/classII large domain-containing protein n=3 Tax=Candidatus Woeseibacteriota TaxID=1752722 RepID=A0A0G0UV67_9BACT|nr:MAG: hypothetical protein UT17_C0002G0035 [Candidatus Woesebacteria bacterium GW2011_GWB1_39_10]KKR73628.1 MAG: hypothetical protein UU16_C0017G0004 [Candidatus Woesebacteria bacterium GW2011_GWA2_40_7]KKR92614.1 MAG: hypothetical protein UU42_C0001G0218 [Candidatus Woesebacteria bacterium GW2011_GWA1_41_13b]